MKIIILIGFLCTILMMGCDGSKSKLTSLEKATNQFEDGRYGEALAAYQSLIPGLGSVARVGAGWCEIKLGHYNEAVSYFEDAANDSLVQGYAGWSLASWSQGLYQDAISKINFVLRVRPNYKSSFDDRVTADKLILIQASSYFLMGNYEATVQKIREIPGQESYNPNLSASDIAKRLLEKLENLGGDFVLLKSRLNVDTIIGVGNKMGSI